jgi:hypothetical protein
MAITRRRRSLLSRVEASGQPGAVHFNRSHRLAGNFNATIETSCASLVPAFELLLVRRIGRNYQSKARFLARVSGGDDRRSVPGRAFNQTEGLLRKDF